MALNFFVFAVITILTLGFYYVRRQFSYWKVRGVPFVKPEFPLGNLKGVSTTRSLAEIWTDAYKELKPQGPIGGVFFTTSPSAMVTDLDLLRNVFVKDFQHFYDRGMYVNEKDDPLSAHLFNLEGARWKNLRAKLTPTFTSGKMKMMFPTMLNVVEQFHDHLESQTNGKETELELKELLAQFTTDVIGNTAFGVECNSMKDPNSEFRRQGKRVFDNNLPRMMKMIFILNFQELARKMGLRFTISGVTEFFMNLLRDTVKYREENNVHRNDFLSLLMQIMNTGKLEGETKEIGKMTFNELAAQVFLFFIAGFETSSSTMTFAFYELAVNQDVQDKAREQIEEVLEKHNGEFTYEAAMELTYVDQIIQETLRKYPIVDTLLRKVTIPYKVPNTEITLDSGMRVLIPVMGIHRDPEIYPEPEKFDPERFTKENIAARHPYAWIPFGEGPRNCIGLRFGMMQTRLGIAMILKNFIVTPSKKTNIPLTLDPAGQLLSPAGGMFLNLKPIVK